MQSICWTTRLVSRALRSGFSTLVEPSNKVKPHFVSVACGFPKDFLRSKYKLGRFGEDAWFVASTQNADVIGKYIYKIMNLFSGETYERKKNWKKEWRKKKCCSNYECQCFVRCFCCCCCFVYVCVCVFVLVVERAKCVKRIELKCAQYEGCACVLDYRLFCLCIAIECVLNEKVLCLNPDEFLFVVLHNTCAPCVIYGFLMHIGFAYFKEQFICHFTVIIPFHSRTENAPCQMAQLLCEMCTIFSINCVILFTLMTLWQRYK